MVTGIVAPLDRKLLRDLWHMRGQALAIAMIVASGVAVLIMSLSAMQALSDSGSAYYDRYRFADVFASVKRAPSRIVDAIERLPGVQTAEGRITRFAMLGIDGFDEPVTGQLVSLPDTISRGARGKPQPTLNRLVIRGGRLPRNGSVSEVAISEPFAEAHALQPGSRFTALINGRRRALDVTGVVLSPEFIYAIAPGALMPDPTHFGILWMSETALAAAYDLEGAVNSVAIALARGASGPDVITAVDSILEDYGGTGAFDRDDQISNWFLQNEIQQLRTMASILPTIFLIVAAFLTNMVLARLVTIERSEIGLLKAFGHSNATVVWHYAKMVVAMSTVGLLIGWAAGVLLGRWLTETYATLFRFPDLVFAPKAEIFVLSVAVGVGASLIGAIGAARRAGSLPPAEAMRPPAPPAFRHSRWKQVRPIERMDQPTRIIFRQVLRRPVRSLVTSAGLAASLGLLILSLQWLDALEVMVDDYFHEQQRYDASISFSDARRVDIIHDVNRLPGVLGTEPTRTVAARLIHGHLQKREAITGLPDNMTLVRLTDADRIPVAVPDRGLMLSDTLADLLNAGPGDLIRIEILQGHRRRLDVPVAAVFKTTIGTPAYMDLNALNVAIGEPGTTDTVISIVDPSRESALFAEIRDIAAIASVTLKRSAVEMFERTIAESMMVMIAFYIAFAGVMAFGMVYNNMRIALSERGRELATLRVLGFRPGEISYMLFGESALLTLIGLPLGCLFGWFLAHVMSAAFNTELFRMPVVFEPATYGLAVLISLAAALPSAWLVQRRLSRLDLIGVLKTRE